MCDRELTVDETAAVRKGVGGDVKDAADKGPPRAESHGSPVSGRLAPKRPAVDSGHRRGPIAVAVVTSRLSATRPASRRATGMRNGEQET